MIKAASNFSHAVAFRKRVDHRLVTGGIYASVTFFHTFITFPNAICSWFRHPSYAGFFYWALGTQLVLQNPLSFCVYCVLLMRFFSSRIRGEPLPLHIGILLKVIIAEERALISFFGDEYVAYRKRVGTRIPFIP